MARASDQVSISPSLLAANGGDGTDGIVFNGFAADDMAGNAAGLGDINADGLPDLRIGAQSADPNGLTNAGQAYIVYGKAVARPGFGSRQRPA